MALGIDRQFMWGPALLISPILEQVMFWVFVDHMADKSVIQCCKMVFERVRACNMNRKAFLGISLLIKDLPRIENVQTLSLNNT